MKRPADLYTTSTRRHDGRSRRITGPPRPAGWDRPVSPATTGSLLT
ncbi:hypothetical protein [Bradyrhizobium sp. BR 1432]